MKKKIIYTFLVIIFLICIFSTKSSAKSISADNVESRTYIVGEHMYTRDVNGDYTGRLTTQYIMYGASTIEGDDIQEFIIYYKNPLGEWKNALTNQAVTVPEKFDIKYTNGELTVNLQYGDVNCDGRINSVDVTVIRRYLAGYEMTEEIEMTNGDVNGDGKITEADVVLLRKYIAGNYPNAKLPNEPLGKTHIIEYMVDEETYEIDYELDGETLVEPTEPEKEGYIFEGWYTDVDYKTKFEFRSTTVIENIKLYAKFVKPQYGDVNCDGIINTTDIVFISRYAAGYLDDKVVEIKNGDINGDGRITEADATLLAKYIQKYYPDADLSEGPLGNSYIIEYIIDEEIYEIDYELEGKPIFNDPTEPEKEGYIFEGWYTDVEYTTKFEFGSTPIIRNTKLYAKFTKLQYGDVDCNGEINTRDVIYISQYVDGYEMPEEVYIANGDVNEDGRVSEADEILLSKYLAGYYPDANLPEEPLGKSYIVEYLIDNISDFETYAIDYELEGKTLVAPDEPEKEGYTFEGWYTLIDDKKFEFGTTVVTRNIELYAKFVENAE